MPEVADGAGDTILVFVVLDEALRAVEHFCQWRDGPLRTLYPARIPSPDGWNSFCYAVVEFPSGLARDRTVSGTGLGYRLSDSALKGSNNVHLKTLFLFHP